MKVCHRCGHQGEADWVAVEVREHGTEFGAITFRQPCPHIRQRKGADPAEWPQELRVREFPDIRAPP